MEMIRETMILRGVHVDRDGVCGPVELVTTTAKTRLYPGGLSLDHKECSVCGQVVAPKDVADADELKLLLPDQEPIGVCTCGGVRWIVTEHLEQECGGVVQRVPQYTQGCTGCGWPEEGGSEVVSTNSAGIHEGSLA